MAKVKLSLPAKAGKNRPTVSENCMCIMQATNRFCNWHMAELMLLAIY